MSNLVSILGTKLLNLMRVTSAELTDYLVLQKDTKGDQFTRIISIDDFLKQVEASDLETIKETSGDYTALITDDFVVGENTITLTFPTLTTAIKSLTFKNNGVNTITLDGNGSSVENGTVLSTTQARKFIPTTSGWLEVT